MKIRDVSHSTSTPRQRVVYPDPFDPLRRGTALRPGQRAPVLTRRERQARDRSAMLERAGASEDAQWVARIAAQERIPEFVSAHASAHARRVARHAWPAPLNHTGQVADSLVRLIAPHLSGDSNGAQGFHVAREASMGELAVHDWIRQRCGAMTQIAQIASGGSGSIRQALVSAWLRPSCSVTFDAAGHVVRAAALAAASDRGTELRLTTGVRLRPLSAAAASAAAAFAHESLHALAGDALMPFVERVNRTARFLAAGAGSLGILNVPAQDVQPQVDAFADLWSRLDEVLMSPCSTGARGDQPDPLFERPAAGDRRERRGLRPAIRRHTRGLDIRMGRLFGSSVAQESPG
jgi:hypothetical protein